MIGRADGDDRVNARWKKLATARRLLEDRFKKPARATDSELRDDDVIIRYDGEDIIGLTILHASKR